MATHTSVQRQLAFSHALVGIKSPTKADHQLLKVLNWGSSASQAARDTKNVLDTACEEMVTSIDDKDKVALWVGLKPAQARALRAFDAIDIGNDPEDREALRALRKIKIPRSTSVDGVLKLPELPVWTRGGGMTRVVVKFNSMQASKLQYYELVNRDPESMLCKPLPVHAEDVFFFHAYRSDSATSIQDRIRGWSQIIKAYLVQTLNSSLDNGGFRPAKKTALVQFPTKAANVLNLQGMINQFASTGSMWLLDQMEGAVRDSNKDFTGAEFEQLIAMERLLNHDLAFDQASAINAHKWLASGHLTPHVVSEYGAYLRKTQTRITHGQLKASLSLFIQYHIHYPEDGTIESCKEAIAKNWLLFHEDTEGLPPKFKSVSSDLKMWFGDHIKMMQTVLDYHQNSMNALVDYHGTAVSGYNLHQLWEKVAQSPDVDSAKLFVLQASWYLAKEMVATCSRTTDMMEEYMVLLKRAERDLSDTQSVTESADEDKDMGM